MLHKLKILLGGVFDDTKVFVHSSILCSFITKNVTTTKYLNIKRSCARVLPSILFPISALWAFLYPVNAPPLEACCGQSVLTLKKPALAIDFDHPGVFARPFKPRSAQDHLRQSPLHSVPLREELQEFARDYRHLVREKSSLHVNYCHLYEESGLWYGRVEVQSPEKLTHQMADFGVVMAIELFLDRLDKNQLLHSLLRVVPPSLYHVQLVINAPDEAGYVKEVQVWQNRVLMRIDDQEYHETYADLFSRIYPDRGLPDHLRDYLDRYCTDKVCGQQRLEDHKPELEYFWLEKGYEVLPDTWGHVLRFHLPNYPVYHLNLHSKLPIKIDADSLDEQLPLLKHCFHKAWSSWKEWLSQKELLTDVDEEHLYNHLHLVWQVVGEGGKESSVRVSNLNGRLCFSLKAQEPPKSHYQVPFLQSMNYQYYLTSLD